MTNLPLSSQPASQASSGGTRTYVAPVVWGVILGVLQTASPLVFWWLDAATVYALGIMVIAAIYVGFAVSDGRTRVIVTETAVATVFIVIAAVAITGSPWLLVVGFFGHGLKDLWQHRRQFVANTRWWPPFCLVIDWVVAAALVVEDLLAGVSFR